jgi:hypothetical protein
MKPFIRIIRHPYEEPYQIDLVVTAWNGKLWGEIEIYTNPGELKLIGRELHGFPKGRDDIVLWEIGSEDPLERWAFYFRFRVFIVHPGGLSAVELRFNNNQKPPYQEVSEFCIPAHPSDLDRLAHLLVRFSELKHTTLEWNISDGVLS